MQEQNSRRFCFLHRFLITSYVPDPAKFWYVLRNSMNRAKHKHFVIYRRNNFIILVGNRAILPEQKEKEEK